MCKNDPVSHRPLIPNKIRQFGQFTQANRARRDRPVQSSEIAKITFLSPLRVFLRPRRLLQSTIIKRSHLFRWRLRRKSERRK